MRPKLTTKQRVYYHLKNYGQMSGSQLEMMAVEWGTKASVISRRARELAAVGTIERLISERGTVQYRLPQRDTFDAEAYLEKLREEELKEQGVLDV